VESARVPFNQLKPLFDKHRDEYEKAALEVPRSGSYILGEQVEAFEKEFAAFVGTEHCVSLNSGLDALRLAFQALGTGPGDEVVVPANTYIASALAVSLNGARPVFAEPDAWFTLDPREARRAISEKTKAILPVHLYGQSCDMESLCRLADEAGIAVVEDCAQSHGALFGGRMTGSFGEAGCFSFYPTKNCGAFGDGGAVTTNDAGLAESLRRLRHYGMDGHGGHLSAGWNSRLDEIQAAFLRVRLRHLGENLATRARNRRALPLRHQEPGPSSCPAVREGANHTWEPFRRALPGPGRPEGLAGRARDRHGRCTTPFRPTRPPFTGSWESARATSPSPRGWPRKSSACRFSRG
jgi:Predicted pyridoxal phosphate-dependent enzyme apparently involved in regulation of cell wall biogenesis